MYVEKRVSQWTYCKEAKTKEKKCLVIWDIMVIIDSSALNGAWLPRKVFNVFLINMGLCIMLYYRQKQTLLMSQWQPLSTSSPAVAAQWLALTPHSKSWVWFPGQGLSLWGLHAFTVKWLRKSPMWVYLNVFLSLMPRLWLWTSQLPMLTRNSPCRANHHSKTFLLNFYKTSWTSNTLIHPVHFTPSEIKLYI